MPWRKWIVRGVVYGIIALCAAATLAYERWTNPDAVREQVIAKLHELFPGAECRWTRPVCASSRHSTHRTALLPPRRSGAERVPERSVGGHLPRQGKGPRWAAALRKIELYKPRLRVRRDRDGKWNLRDLTGKMDPNKPLPTVVVHQGTILFEDRLNDGSAPVIEAGDVNITLINDPVLIVTVRATANSEGLGRLQVQGTIRREPLEPL